jgi:hypothetical protein
MRSAVMVYTGGSSEYCEQYASGGYVIDDCSMRLSCRGGDAGGVAGSPPGEQSGMCLLGIAVGVPREEVFSDRCGGGVEERPSIEGYLATAAAILTSPRPGGLRWGRRCATWEEDLRRARDQLGRFSATTIGWLMVMVPSQSKRCSGGVKTTKVQQKRAYHDRVEWQE